MNREDLWDPQNRQSGDLDCKVTERSYRSHDDLPFISVLTIRPWCRGNWNVKSLGIQCILPGGGLTTGKIEDRNSWNLGTFCLL